MATVATSARNPQTGIWEVISIEPITQMGFPELFGKSDQQLTNTDLSFFEDSISAADVGVSPGEPFLVEVRDDEHQVLVAVEVVAA